MKRAQLHLNLWYIFSAAISLAYAVWAVLKVWH